MDLGACIVAVVFAVLFTAIITGFVFYWYFYQLKNLNKILCPKCKHPALAHTSNYHQFKKKHCPDDDSFTACGKFMWKTDSEGYQRESKCICDMSFGEVLKNNGIDPQSKMNYANGHDY